VAAAAASDGRATVVLGIRPEDLELGAERGIAAHVRRVEHLGAESLATCVLAAGGSELEVVVRTDGAHAPHGGERVQLGVADGAAHWFSPTSGERLADDR
jgi:multiple sugar transport system ATP-binding protein